jgi:hypothetical protein
LNIEKTRRNTVYVVCGVLILAALFALFLYLLLLKRLLPPGNSYVLVCETVALEAFGAAWLVKGETLFRDKRQS